MSQFIEASVEGASVLCLSHPSQLKSTLSESSGQVSLVVYSIGGKRVSTQRLGDSVQLVREILSDAPMVVVSDSDDRAQVLQALRCGVQGYIPTSLSSRVVVAALQLVQAGGTYVPESAIIDVNDERSLADDNQAHKSAPWPDLTPRQTEVLEQLTLGKSNKIIAYKLKMQESTVKVHMRHIMKKLNATNRTEAACIANTLLPDLRIAAQAEPVFQLPPATHKRQSL